MVLLLDGIPDFTSVNLKRYCMNCSFLILYPNLCVGLDITVLPNITRLIKSTKSFPDSCWKFTVHRSVTWNNHSEISEVSDLVFQWSLHKNINCTLLNILRPRAAANYSWQQPDNLSFPNIFNSEASLGSILHKRLMVSLRPSLVRCLSLSKPCRLLSQYQVL